MIKTVIAGWILFNLSSCDVGKVYSTKVNGKESVAITQGDAKVEITASKIVGSFNNVILDITSTENVIFKLKKLSASATPTGCFRLGAFQFADDKKYDIRSEVYTSDKPFKFRAIMQVILVKDLTEEPKLLVPLTGFISYRGQDMTVDTLRIDPIIIGRE